MLKRLSQNALLGLALAVPSLASPALQVTVDQQPVMFDQAPVMQEGRVLVPLRGVFESLGAEVTYLAPSHTIQATRGSTQVQLTLGSRQAAINGSPSMLDVPATTLGGRTMVPLRFVSEALGASVDWNAATQTVAITNNSPTASRPEPVAQAPEKLRIDDVVHSAAGPLTVGDRLHVVMTGGAGGEATFDLMGVQSGIPMREVRPGRYEGTLNIPAGANLQEANVVAHLVSPDGEETMQEAGRAVTFGSQAPPVPPPPQYVVGKIDIWNLRGGMTVDRHFYLEGKTVPNATLHVVAQPQSQPGGLPGRMVKVDGTSDADGYFYLDVDASSLPIHSMVDTTVNVSDASGQPLKPVTLTLKIE